MASEVDISNLALSRLGDSATISSIDPVEGSAQAEHCDMFYPIARDSLLEMHDWNFATRRAALARLADGSPNWRFSYAAPKDMLRALAVHPPRAQYNAFTQPFEVEADAHGSLIILTNQEDADLRYTARIQDTTKFPPLFVDALAWLLASYLAGPVIKGDAGAAMAKSCLQSFFAVLSNARVSDANQRSLKPEHVPEWIAAR